jgi:hypothetical protein
LVGAPPEGAQAPPVAAGASAWTERSPETDALVQLPVVVLLIDPRHVVALESSTEVATAPHPSPVGVPHEHAPHVAGGAVSGRIPPAVCAPHSGPHAGGAPAPA